MSLDRFYEAQADPIAGYDIALAEIRRGRKTGHWIWYIFPQLAGLGRSSMAQKYAIRNFAEACDYLRDPLLRARYEEITAAVQDQIAGGKLLDELMGSEIDALKLVSSLTLFRAAAQSPAADSVSTLSRGQLCDSLLQLIERHGYAPCEQTLRALAG
jgi:uncharacterized protein (DUF1810 family)